MFKRLFVLCTSLSCQRAGGQLLPIFDFIFDAYLLCHCPTPPCQFGVMEESGQILEHCCFYDTRGREFHSILRLGRGAYIYPSHYRCVHVHCRCVHVHTCVYMHVCLRIHISLCTCMSSLAGRIASPGRAPSLQARHLYARNVYRGINYRPAMVLSLCKKLFTHSRLTLNQPRPQMCAASQGLCMVGSRLPSLTKHSAGWRCVSGRRVR